MTLPQLPDPSLGQLPRTSAKSFQPLGVIALVMGIVAMVLVFVPPLRLVGLLLGIAAVVMGSIELARNSPAKVAPFSAIIAGGLAMVLVFFGMAGFLDAGEAAAPESMAKAQSYTVVLKATSTTRGEVRYRIGGTEASESFQGEWEKTARTSDSDVFFMTVSMHHQDPTLPKLGCEILIEGKRIIKNSGTEVISCEIERTESPSPQNPTEP